jgi:hypothetical protein
LATGNFEDFLRLFVIVFFTQEWTPHFLRFLRDVLCGDVLYVRHFIYLFYAVMVPAAPQETVGEAGIEPWTAA